MSRVRLFPLIHSICLIRRYAISSAIAATITACGGGGDAGTGATSAIVAAVAQATYADEDLKAFNILNAERERCGFGLVSQNTKLDTAARGHVNWLELNNGWSHEQIVGTPGFTGVTYLDRVANAGYGPNALASEDLGGFQVVANDSRGIRGLLSAPYHELDMLRGYRDVGVGISPPSVLGAIPRYIVINFGTLPPATNQVPIANTVRTYPCEGSTGVERALRGETPNPVPNRSLGIDPVGTSVAVVGDLGRQMTVTSATMIGPGGVSVALRAPANSTSDPNPGYVRVNEAYVLADAPLQASSTYQVNISGTNGTMPFSKSFSFTTTSY